MGQRRQRGLSLTAVAVQIPLAVKVTQPSSSAEATQSSRSVGITRLSPSVRVKQPSPPVRATRPSPSTEATHTSPSAGATPLYPPLRKSLSFPGDASQLQSSPKDIAFSAAEAFLQKCWDDLMNCVGDGKAGEMRKDLE